MILVSQPVSRNTRPESERPCAIELCGKDTFRHASAIFYSELMYMWRVTARGTLSRLPLVSDF